MGKTVPKDKQCFIKYCRNEAVKDISYFFKKVKVCKSHEDRDMLHEHRDAHGRYPCRCKKGKV
jgi:translation initiation factor 2 beta subunit (eIF-2beta)/eIF-5